MARRALGRGLSALLPDSLSGSLSESLTEGDELLEVDIDLIDPNPEQPRYHFNEVKLEELAQSIKVNGIVQPILLRQTGAGRYQIVAGERRWRAAQRAGLQRVKAVLRDIPDGKLLELALIENIQRQELNPIEEAQAYQRLIQNLGLTQEELARQVGKDRSSIANSLRLLKLPESIKRLLVEEHLSMGHARAILGLDVPELQVKLANDVVGRGMSVRETEGAVRRMTSGGSNADGSTVIRKDANIQAAELKMKRFLGTQVKINLSAHGGKIEIAFSSTSELDRIYSIIMRKSDSEPHSRSAN